ncbi:MAG: hypothetical protein C5B52_05070 [Bacteroidetes bacterium]|nr:MAG: hypothetical protein C5B52_05070 [Bacteroidota bacterium]
MSIKKIDLVANQISKFKFVLSNIRDNMEKFANGELSEEDTFKSLVEANKKYPVNPLLVAKLLEFMQLAKTLRILREFELSDIHRIYYSLCEIYKDDVDLNVEANYFSYFVLDKRK